MKMETTKRWGLMLTNMCYLPYFFFSPSEAADFLNVHPEYKERKIRVVPVLEIHTGYSLSKWKRKIQILTEIVERE